MEKTFVLPKELVSFPKPYIVLTGLNITHNAIHQLVWDAFVNNRGQNRVPIKIACLPGDHSYPKKKTTRTSYDWYIPKGLLKSKWMDKHLNRVPAVVAIFIELEWDDPAWQERHQACASRVQVVRASLQGRNTKLCVVLLQNQKPVPAGDDPSSLAVTRAGSLCKACDLSSKMLFVVPIIDNLKGYVTRLESTFFELAQKYYFAEIKVIDSHYRDMNKTTHQLLYARHQFKIAFFNEMMNEQKSSKLALKHYNQCYQLIKDLRSYETNNLEIKLVAGLVNYKICHLSFMNSEPLEAINHFKKHISEYKSRFGSEELLFEHSAWLSHQYTWFGEIFQQAVNNGLNAIQTQHPGFYFYQASRYARGRKNYADSICSKINSPYPSPDPLFTENLEFYGQRPWRQGQQRIDPPDVDKEKEGILAIQLKELEFDHSNQIIHLLSSALSHMKKFRSSRLQQNLINQVATEHSLLGNDAQAISLFKRVIKEYAKEGWSLVLSHCLSSALHTSFKVADIHNFLFFCLSSISKISGFDEKTKCNIQLCFDSVVQGSFPEYDYLPVCSTKFKSLNLAECENKWNKSFSAVDQISINMNNIVSFVDCKISFSCSETPLSSVAKVYVFLKFSCPMQMNVSQLKIGFQNSSYDIKHTFNEGNKLVCEPGKTAVKVFEVSVNADHVKKVLCVTSFSLMLGKTTSKQVNLFWQWPEAKPSDEVHTLDENVLDNLELWESLPSCHYTTIIERPSKIDLQILHEAPALTSEVYPITFVLNSNEDDNCVAEDITLELSLKNENLTSFFYESLDDLSKKGSNLLIKKIPSISPNESDSFKVYLVSHSQAQLDVLVNVSYYCKNVKSSGSNSLITCKSTITKHLTIEVCPAFSLETSNISLESTPISTIKLNRPFLYMMTVKPVTKWPISIISSSNKVLMTNSISQLDFGKCLMPEVDSLSLNEVATDYFQATLRCHDDNEASLEEGSKFFGEYAIQWKRAGCEEGIPPVWTTIKLPCLPLQKSPLNVSMETPPFAVVYDQTRISYKMHNSTEHTCQVEIKLDSAELFTFSGRKQQKVLIMPFSSHVAHYNVFPLATGLQTLPKFTATVLQHGTDGFVNSVADHSQLVTSIYVKDRPIKSFKA